MKINVSVIVAGKFHSFYLAEQLQKEKMLLSLITSYPTFLVRKNNIEKKNIISLPFKEIIERIFIKLKLSKFLKYLYYYLNFIFEISASKKIDIKNTDIVVGWSGCVEKTFMKINKNNKKVIKLLERGSSHILYQNKILAEEYDLFSYKKNPIDPKIIQKEIREYNLADYIVVPSEFAKRSFIDHGINKNKILKIPYGVNLKQFNRSFLKNKEFTIICVGTVSLRKGSYYLMKAFKELNLTNSKLIFVGTIDPEIQQIIKPFVNDSNINFIGHVSQNRLKEFYSTSHISVICSIEEGMAMVQAQAMASGVPLICTTNSGGEDIVDENVNGFICPIRDVEYLKEKISFFYNNRNILKLFSDNAYNKAQNFLSWDNYGKRVSEEYKKLATKHL
tara:strand:- start:2311 stop:3483 length:1173 start_codon:yes stop_codon:yes gene_type:complete